jgi:hypothetical protein
MIAQKIRIAEQPERERQLAPEEIADLAADEDERRRHQRLDRDRALHAADRRVEVLHDLRDRNVHERRVDHEDEHRHREQQAEAPGLVGGQVGGRAGVVVAHRSERRRRCGGAPACAHDSGGGGRSAAQRRAGDGRPELQPATQRGHRGVVAGRPDRRAWRHDGQCGIGVAQGGPQRGGVLRVAVAVGDGAVRADEEADDRVIAGPADVIAGDRAV